MKAISILQPWPWLIVRPDLTDKDARAQAARRGHMKDIENRRWNTHFRGRFLIHAGKKWGREQADDLAFVREAFPGLRLPSPSDLQLGGIVGIATMIGVVTTSESPWFFGPFGFCIEDPVPVRFVPYRGSLGWFDVPEEVVSSLEITV